jgi:hypothetical protein
MMRIGAAVLLLGVARAGGGPPAPAGEAIDYVQWLAENSDALVTVKFVLKVNMRGHMGGYASREREAEVTGMMIDPQGLVLCSNSRLSGYYGSMRRRGSDVSVVPTDLKVLVGGDTEGAEAEFMTRDTELDLAWVRIKEPRDEPYIHIDLTHAAKPLVGQRLFSVSRMNQYFDRTVIVSEGILAGTTDKPRDLFVGGGGVVRGAGLPVFTVDGALVGVSVIQVPEEGEEDAGRSLTGSRSGLILPAESVVKATKRARATAAELEEE